MSTIAELLRQFFAPVAKWLLRLSPLAGLFLLFQEWVRPLLLAGLDDAHAWFVANATWLSVSTANVSQYLGYANYIFPVAEAFVMLTALFALRVVCVIVRLIKGIIPTLG